MFSANLGHLQAKPTSLWVGCRLTCPTADTGPSQGFAWSGAGGLGWGSQALPCSDEGNFYPTLCLYAFVDQFPGKEIQ